MRPDRNLALDLWQHESTHVLTDGRWREVELFLPADLNLSEVTDYPPLGDPERQRGRRIRGTPFSRHPNRSDRRLV
jgi:hypothetical protein